GGDLAALDLAAIGEVFDAEHKKVFEFTLDTEREVVSVRAIVQRVSSTPRPPELPTGGLAPSDAVAARASIWCRGARQEGGIDDRTRLAAGNRVPEPAIVTEMDSTTLIHPGHEAEVDRYGNLLIRPV